MKLSDLVDFNPKTMTNKLGHVPFIDMSALPTHGRDISAIKLQLARESGSKFKNGDTIIARITPCLENGKGAKITGLPGLGVGQGSTEFIVMRAKFESDENFVYYLSRHPNFRLYAIQQMSGTTGRQRVSWQAISNYELIYISRKNRELFGKILSNLDDKIELNRRMNETLEAMAQAIFRDWFVDFGPVRRKASGLQDPVAILGGMIDDAARAATLAALFPDRFEEDGLPVGWEEKSFGEIVVVISGGTPKTSEAKYWDGNIPWFSVVDTPSGSDTFVLKTEKNITNQGLSNCSARLIAAGTTIITARGTVGNLAVAGCEMTFNQSCYALTSSEAELPYFTYLATGTIVERLKSMAHGSVFSTITRQTFDNVTLPVSNLEFRVQFEMLIAPLFERIKFSVQENQILAETRDYLLPKLMSGEIRVSDAEALMKEAAE